MKVLQVRLTDEEMQRLDDVVRIYDTSRAQFIKNAINSTHDEINGNPKLKAVLQQLKAITESLNKDGLN